MDIEILKRAADWMGEEVAHENEHRIEVKHYTTMVDGVIYENGTELFNPHEDANLLKKMEEKLSHKEFGVYENLMRQAWYSNDAKENFTKWFKTAPTKLCFEKLMEVI